jgi:hypothetical protein
LEAREGVSRRLTLAVAALESLRLNLIRLRADVGTMDDILQDLSRARELELEIKIELAAHEEVQRLIDESC